MYKSKTHQHHEIHHTMGQIILLNIEKLRPTEILLKIGLHRNTQIYIPDLRFKQFHHVIQ